MKHIQKRPLAVPALPAALKRSTAVLAVVLAASLLTACQPATHVHGPSAPQPAYFTELEPNDFPDFPDFVGILDDRSFLVVEGYVEAFGFDVVDHIEFESDRPIEIDFTLEALGAHGDVDVSIYDPISNQIVGTYASDGRYEVGTIIVHDPGRPFQFIIEAYNSNTAWSLELIAYPHGCACRTTSGLEEDGAGGGLDHDVDLASLPDAPALELAPIIARQEHALLRLNPE